MVLKVQERVSKLEGQMSVLVMLNTAQMGLLGAILAALLVVHL